MATELNMQDIGAISEGKVVATIDGKNITLLEAKEFTPEVEFNKEDVRALGNRWVGSKVTSISGSGTLNLYYVSSMWNQIVEKYSTTGYLPKMSVTGTMEDTTTGIGKQTVRIDNFMPDSVKLIHLEADDGTTEQEMDFTFSGFKVITAFKDIKR